MKKFLIFFALFLIFVVISYLPMMSSTISATFRSNRADKPAYIDRSEYVTKTVRESGAGGPSIDVEYPYFIHQKPVFNTMVGEILLSKIREFRYSIAEEKDLEKYTFTGRWKPIMLNDNKLSFILNWSTYTGGANENEEFYTINYDIDQEKIIELSELFANDPNYLVTLSTIARPKIKETLKDRINEDGPIIKWTEVDEGTQPKIDNYKYFTFTKEALQLYFPKYSLAPGSFGIISIEIPFKEFETASTTVK